MIDSNYKKIRFVLASILFLNLLVSFTKIFLGYYTNSQSVYADGFHSLSDGFNNIIGIVALSIAYKPADENHPYGHKKIETILSLFIGFILLLMSYNIFVDALKNFNKPLNLNISIFSILIMIATMIVNIFVTIYEKKKGEELNSSFLISDAKHTMSDVYVSASVVISLIGIKYLGLPEYFDTIISFLVVIFIFKTAITIIIDSSKILSDTKIINPELVEEIVYSFDDVKECHMIKSRGFDNFAFLELHVLVDENMSVKIAHSLSHDIETKIKKEIMKNVNVVIHIEPFGNSHIDEE
ncbi:cation diffusion facilitator family transporter [Bacilli bacterium PM5-3]|nr:cation diffusion facilitator family transporter [Bacilli bacterium PM5-3]